jgi:hypothetical protein
MEDASALHADQAFRPWICGYDASMELYGVDHAQITARMSGAQESLGSALRSTRRLIRVLLRSSTRVLDQTTPSKIPITNHSYASRDDLRVPAYRIFQVHRVGPCDRLAGSGPFDPAVAPARCAVGVRAGSGHDFGGVASARAEVSWSAARSAFPWLAEDSRRSLPSYRPEHNSKGNGN